MSVADWLSKGGESARTSLVVKLGERALKKGTIDRRRWEKFITVEVVKIGEDKEKGVRSWSNARNN